MAKKYLLLMLNREMPMPTDPKEREANTKPWTDWLAEMAKQGKLDNGLPVFRDGRAVRKRSVKEYKAKTTDVGGYLIINAESMEEAIKIAQSSPHARMNMGTTIVRECMDVSM